MRVSDRMTAILTEKLKPSTLDIRDESDRHAGHAGHDGGGESHFRVMIVSHFFTGKTRLERHRMVYDCLAAELKDRIHALSIKALAPDEAAISPQK